MVMTRAMTARSTHSIAAKTKRKRSTRSVCAGLPSRTCFFKKTADGRSCKMTNGTRRTPYCRKGRKLTARQIRARGKHRVRSF